MVSHQTWLRYAFLITPYLGGLLLAICDAILGVLLGLAGASAMNLLLPGGAAGPEYLPPEFFDRTWLPLRHPPRSLHPWSINVEYHGLCLKSQSPSLPVIGYRL